MVEVSLLSLMRRVRYSVYGVTFFLLVLSAQLNRLLHFNFFSGSHLEFFPVRSQDSWLEVGLESPLETGLSGTKTIDFWLWPTWLSWLEHRPTHGRVVGLIPS